MTRSRIMKRRRCITVLVLSVLMITTMLNFTMAKSSDKDTISIVVKSGENIWNIAKKNNPNEMDIRQLVYEIIKANELTDGNIYAGQELIIPVN